MGYDWNQEAHGEGSDSEKIPAGSGVVVTISKIVYGKKGGKRFVSNSGDPQIMLIFRDDDEREASMMVTLSKRAGWVLARLLSRFGADTQALTDAGIEPRHFAEERIANQYLVGLRGQIDISYNESGYAEIEPCEGGTAPGRVAVGKTPTPDTTVSDEDIPF